MTDERFWALIEKARANGFLHANSTHSVDPARMRRVLQGLGDEEVTDFGLTLYSKVCDLNSWHLWAAGYVIAGGMSDDSFHYFRTWIVGKGKAVFDIAMTDPDALGPYVDDPMVDNESLEYAAIEVLRARGSDIDPRELSSRHADGEPFGEAFTEESAAESFPKLAALFG